jgi:hypothetical protein
MKHNLEYILPVLCALLGLCLGLQGATEWRDRAAYAAEHNQTSNRAGLVVRYGDGSTETACVSFSEEAITGYDLLRRSNIPVIADLGSGMGAFVCKIGNDGCNFPQEDCACKFNTEQRYWSYWVLQNGAWQYSNLGAGNASVKSGDVQGWAWSTGSASTEANTKPPVLTLAQICSAAAPATPTPTHTATALPTPTVTPTLTPQPPTPTPTSTPVPVVNVIAGGQVILTDTPQPTPTNAGVVPVVSTQQPTSNAQAQAIVVGVVVATAAPEPSASPPPPTPLPSPSPVQLASATSTATPAPAPEPALTITSSPAPTAPPTPLPTPSLIATSSATPVQSALPSATPSPTPSQVLTPTASQTQAAQPAANVLGYALFGLMALGLAVGIVLLRVRQ